MNNLYETGGVPPLPAWLQDKPCKCQKCGGIWVGVMNSLCPKCKDEPKKETA